MPLGGYPMYQFSGIAYNCLGSTPFAGPEEVKDMTFVIKRVCMAYREFTCSNCGHQFESKLDVLWTVCPKCGGRAYPD